WGIPSVAGAWFGPGPGTSAPDEGAASGWYGVVSISPVTLMKPVGAERVRMLTDACRPLKGPVRLSRPRQSAYHTRQSAYQGADPPSADATPPPLPRQRKTTRAARPSP